MTSTPVLSGLLVALAAVAWGPSALGADRSTGPGRQQAEQPSPGATSGQDQSGSDHSGGSTTGHSTAAHGSGGINPVAWKEIQGDLAIWTAVVFLLLLAVLWKFAWGPIRSGLEKREQGIADQIAQAEQSNRKAQQLLDQYDRRLSDSKAEVRGILDKGRRDAEALGREMLDKAKQESQAEQQRALRQIDAATANALKQLAEQSSTLAVQLAGKILQVELKPQDHARLIQQAVSDFGQKQPRSNGTRVT